MGRKISAPVLIFRSFTYGTKTLSALVFSFEQGKSEEKNRPHFPQKHCFLKPATSSDFRWVFTTARKKTVSSISGWERGLIKWKANCLSYGNSAKC